MELYSEYTFAESNRLGYAVLGRQQDFSVFRNGVAVLSVARVYLFKTDKVAVYVMANVAGGRIMTVAKGKTAAEINVYYLQSAAYSQYRQFAGDKIIQSV